MAGEEVAEELPRELNPSNAGPFLIVEKNKLAVKYTGGYRLLSTVQPARRMLARLIRRAAQIPA